MNEFSKIPPQAIEIEEAVLGALILESKEIVNVIDLLSKEVFYKSANGLIYEAILDLYNSDGKIDILTVTNRLRENGTLESVGGAYYITQLTNRIASAAHLVFHSQILVQNYMKREMITLSCELESKAYDDGVDILDLLGYAEMNIKNIQERYVSETVSPDDILDIAIKEVEKRVDNFSKGIQNSIPTPVSSINKLIVGAEKGEVIIIAARTSQGKTQFAIKWAEEAARRECNPVFFSLEMSSVEIVNRRVCSDAGIDSVNFRSGNLNKTEIEEIRKSKERIKRLPVIVERSIDIHNIKTKARHNVNRNCYKIIFIDYLQLISRPGKNDNSEIERISRELKLLAQELDVPIILLSQLNREVESTSMKIPGMNHLRSSGAIEQDADIIMFLWRPFVYGIEKFEYSGHQYDNMDFSDIFTFCPKFRNGAIGFVHFKAAERMSYFYDVKDHREEFEPISGINNNFESQRDENDIPF